MELGLITIISALHDATSIENSHYDLINGLKKCFSVRFITPSETKYVDIPIVFVASGGTEEMFRNIYDELPQPILLLTDGLHNSLAASMEIQSWVKELGGSSEILHGSPEHLKNKIDSAYKIISTANKLKKSTIGAIGFPSPWLIASDVDYIKVKSKWGTTYKNIELASLSELLSEISVVKAKEVAELFIESSCGISEANNEDVLEASKVYLALKELCRQHKLDAATLKCFDILDKYKTTGCLALSLLNDEGLISGCEGDCQSVFSMYISKLLTGETPFIANPALIDTDTKEAIFAHCTLATSIAEKYIIRSHFESRIGVGIQGEIRKGPITLFKCGGSDLSKYFVSKGEIIDNLNNPNMCRTQLKVRLEEDVNYFFNNPIANHHIIIRGDHADILTEFMNKMSCTRVR